MQKAITRLFITSMLMLISAITLVASTFAWVGIYSTSKWENFDVDLEVVDKLEEYGIEVSLTGLEGSFTSKIDQDELKRVILKNYGYAQEYLATQSNEDVRQLFSEITFDQASVTPSNNELRQFYGIDGLPTSKIMKFDLYISAYKAEIESTISESEFCLDAYLKGDLFIGTKQTVAITNEFEYPTNFINPALNGIQGGTKVKDNLTVDSSSVVRCAFQKYQVVDKYHPDRYSSVSTKVNDLIIYQGGTQMPTYNPVTGVYSFGGCLSDEINLSTFDYNVRRDTGIKSIPDGVKNRGDIEYISTNLNQIVDSQKDDEKIHINQMMKMTVLFWFEGYDADCFAVVDRSPVKLNIQFVANKENN